MPDEREAADNAARAVVDLDAARARAPHRVSAHAPASVHRRGAVGSAPDGWLARGDVAKRLGMSKTSVRRLEESGELAPVQDAAGNWRFDPAAVEELARSRAAGSRGLKLAATPAAGATPTTTPSKSITTPVGARPVVIAKAPVVAPDVDARVFELIAAGAPLREIVVRLALPAAVVEASARAWARLATVEGEVGTMSIGERVDELEVARSEVEPVVFRLVGRVTQLERVLGGVLRNAELARAYPVRR